MPVSNFKNDFKSSHWPLTIISSTVSLLNFILPLVIVRCISQDEFGLYKIFFLYLFSLPQFTLVTGLFSGLAFWSGQAREKDVAYKTSGILILGLSMIVASFILLTAFLPALKDIFPWSGWEQTVIILFAISSLSALFASFYEEAAITSGKTLNGAIFQAVFEIGKLITVVFTALYFKTLLSILITFTIISLLKLTVSLYLSLKENYLSLSLKNHNFSQILKYALPVSISGAFGILISRADQFILSSFISPREFAIYTIGCLSLAPILTLEQSINRVLIPGIAKDLGDGNFKQASKRYRKSSGQIAIFCIPVFFGLSTFALPIIKILFGEAYLSASSILVFYSFTYLLLFSPYDAVARAMGNSKIILYTTIVFALLSISLAFVLTSNFGVYGALGSYLSTSILFRLWWLFYNKKVTGWNFKDFFPTSIVTHSFIICALISSISLVSKQLFSSDITWFILFGGVYPILYFLGLLFLDNLKHKKTSPSNILILTQSLAVGGLERMAFNLALELKANKLYPVLFSYDHNSAQHQAMSFVDNIKESGLPVVVFKKKSGLSIGVIIQLIKTVLDCKINIIHCQDIGGLIYATIVKILTLNRIKILQTQHSFIHLQKKPAYKTYEKLFSYFADQISSVSLEIQNIYQELGFKSELIPNGVGFLKKYTDQNEKTAFKVKLLNQLNLSIDLYKDKVWITYLARIHKGKGQIHSIDLVNLLSNTNFHLFLVGPIGDQKEYNLLIDKINNSKHKDKITVIPGTKDSESWIKAMDIYISCSESEGMPLAPLEAVGSGIPALLSDIPGHNFLKEYVDSFSLNSIEDGAKLLEKMIASSNNESLLKAWEKSLNLRGHFSVDTMAKRYIKLYSKL